MADGFLAWANRQMQYWEKLIPMLQNRVIMTHEVRGGQQVDTTDETISETTQRLAELSALVAEHEARSA